MNGKAYVLVVETDDLIRELLERWLGEAGYVVIVGASGDSPRHEEPRLIIVNLPSPRGSQALVRSLKAAYSAPILALSARFRPGLAASREAARRLGVCKLLPKPFSRGELLEAIRELLPL